MAGTNFAGANLNNLGVGITGGLIPTDNIIRSVASWADALEPRRTPVLQRCGKGKAIDQVKVEWGQSYHTAISGTTAEAIDDGVSAGTETAIDLTAGEGKLLQPWMVLEIINWADAAKTRLDYTNREEVVIQSISGDTITVQRGAGSNSFGVAAKHDSGAYWAVCGVAMPYNTDFALSPFTRGDLLYNHPQRFYGEVAADVAARNTPTYETSGDQLLRDLEEQTMLMKFYLERAIVSGARQAGDANGTTTATTQKPYKMGGIDYFITKHSGRVLNMNGKTLSAYDLEGHLREMFKEVDDGGAKTLLMGPDTASIFDSLLNPIRQATVSDTKVNLVVDAIKFRWGTLEIMPTQHMPEGQILFVDFKDIKVHPYKGVAWSTKTISTDGPYDKIAIFGDYTVTVDRVQRMGKIHGFDMNLDNYPRKEFF